MKIAWFKENISPEVGTLLAGYGTTDRAVMKLDDLYAAGLCVEEGKNRVLIVSFDLLGLDGSFIQENRKKLAGILGIPEAAVLFSCTHTHCGPHTRSLAGRPEMLNREYLDKLSATLCRAVGELGDFREVLPMFYSCFCDENRNRRYTSGDNRTVYTPFRREVVPANHAFADKELGEVLFMDPKTMYPVYVIANYAAHPLAGHTPGLGSQRISADYPGALREYVRENLGAECMFVSGAAGDLVPREDEQGTDAFRSLGVRLGKELISGAVEVSRNGNRYALPDAGVAARIDRFSMPLRLKYRNVPENLPEEYLKKDSTELEIQSIAIGDVAFVGVPGELCCELGQEIKWHSPFRRTFIAYNSTAYFSYFCPANFLVSGGYEAMHQRMTARAGLQLVNTAVDSLFQLRESMEPSREEPYPDHNKDVMVNILTN